VNIDIAVYASFSVRTVAYNKRITMQQSIGFRGVAVGMVFGALNENV
jgi:hypothetical protein